MDEAEGCRDEIVRIEARIEELAGVIESCRKMTLLARAAIVLGAVLLTALMLGALRFDPLVLFVAIAAVLGGIVLFGSNNSTRAQAAAELQKVEARRAELISWIRPRLVGGTAIH